MSIKLNSEYFRSQFNEDRILANHFNNKTNGVCIEIGAYNGEDLSNTYYFEKIGWDCILVEAIPELAAICREKRKFSTVINCAVVDPDSPSSLEFEIAEDVKAMSSVSITKDNLRKVKGYAGQLSIRKVLVPARTLDSILEESDFQTIDFITIDVEGSEWNVLQGFTLSKWQPKVLIIERNSFFPNLKIMKYLQQNDYILQMTTGCNDWFYLSAKGSSKKILYKLWLFWYYYLSKLPIAIPKYFALLLKRSLIKLNLFDEAKSLFKKFILFDFD